MNSHQISHVLSLSKASRRFFRGVFPADAIPNFKREKIFPISLVANTDKLGQPGKHWVGMFITAPNRIEYFDSFGIWPPESPDIFQYLSAFKYVTKNRSKIQNLNENSCGPHVIYFLIKRSFGKSFARIENDLNRLHPYDDAYVKYHVYSLVYKSL